VYEVYYNLARCPFVETVSPLAYVELPSRDICLRRLRYGLEQSRGPTLLFGPPGAGKTMLVRRLARDLGVSPIHLTFPALSAPELLCVLAEELGGPFPTTLTMASALHEVRCRLADSARAGRKPLLIIDEAHLIDDPATFEALRLLLNFAATGPPDLSLILVGTAELLLQLPPSMVDRLTARCPLGPLTEAESSSYIQGRLAAAGATTVLFGPDALLALHRAALGIPRRLNLLADLSLLVAFAQGQTEVNTRIVALAAQEFQVDPLAA
jgi:type II secretory pathway predicted ATPase ExeA